MNVTERVREAAERALAGGDVEVVDVEVRGSDRHPVVTLTVDRPGGVSVEDCAQASTAISRALDEDDPFPGAYRLDVQSPGLERPLRTDAEFVRAVGRQVSVKRQGHQPLVGELLAVNGPALVVRTDDGPVEVELASVVRARTVLEWGNKQDKKKRGASR